MKKRLFVLFLFACLFQLVFAQANEQIQVNLQDRKVLFNDHWKFYRGVQDAGEDPLLADATWREISLPHDWSKEPIGLLRQLTSEIDAGFKKLHSSLKISPAARIFQMHNLCKG